MSWKDSMLPRGQGAAIEARTLLQGRTSSPKCRRILRGKQRWSDHGIHTGVDGVV